MCHSYGVQKHLGDVRFYRYAMPNGIYCLENAVRHYILVANY